MQPFRPRDAALRADLPHRLHLLASLAQRARSSRLLATRTGLRDPHLRTRLPDVYSRPPTGDESLLFGDFRRMGLRPCSRFSSSASTAMESVQPWHRLIGFCTLIVAHHLAMSGDTLEMMRAVLDSNFWLATHVIVITFGYSAMFLAGFLRSCSDYSASSANASIRASARPQRDGLRHHLFRHAVQPRRNHPRRHLGRPKLGPLLGLGSEGKRRTHDRHHGRDLSARALGRHLPRAWLMSFAICGNIVTSWSWFGTNLLGVGLHSYGFTEGGFFWVAVFCLGQLFFIASMFPCGNCGVASGQKRKAQKARKKILQQAAQRKRKLRVFRAVADAHRARLDDLTENPSQSERGILPIHGSG